MGVGVSMSQAKSTSMSYLELYIRHDDVDEAVWRVEFMTSMSLAPFHMPNRESGA